MTSFADMNRRTFRGRAGPTDGRLNKHQARRRKQPKILRDEKDTQNDASNKSDFRAVVKNTENEKRNKNSNECNENNAEPLCLEGKNNCSPFPTEASLADKEINHLLKRIKILSDSISLSSNAISKPETWRNNVLNAVKNCIIEWRAILTHYELDEIQIKEPALAAFMLIQQSMQSGPLTGSNPGYFKRCGSSVAKQASIFLNETIPTSAATDLYFTDKQSTTIEKWKIAAASAAAKDKPPSKSQLKKQSGKAQRAKKR